MANERIRSIRIFRGAVKRSFGNRVYIVQCITVFLLSLMSMFLLGQICQVKMYMPNVGIESLKIGNVYNIGVLSVQSLDVYYSNVYDELLVGALSGSFIQGVMAWCIAVFIAGEYKKGYVKLQLTKGARRFELFLKYIGAALINVLPLIILYVLGLIMSVKIESAMSGTARMVTDAAYVTSIIVYQSAMLLGIAAIEASLMMIFENIKWLIFLEGIVFIAPLMPTYISLFTNGRIQLEKWSIFSAVINISVSGFENIGLNLALLFGSVVVFGIIGILILSRKNYE